MKSSKPISHPRPSASSVVIPVKSEIRNPKSEVQGPKSEVQGPPPEARFDPAAARVELADVPFVPLRNLFQRELGRPAGRFSLLVDSCREQVRQHVGEQVRLVVEQSRPGIEVNGTRVKLAPREHLVLQFLVTRANRGEPAYAAQKDGLDDLNRFREALRAAAPPSDWADWRHGDALKLALEDQELRRALSSLRDRLRAAAGNAHLLAACLPQKGRFSLTVPGSLIHLKS